MLEELTVRDLALLRQATLRPAKGLTVISGQTGGGKTLVVQALRLLRGEKADADVVRHGATAATIDGSFALTGGERSRRVRELYAEILGQPVEDERIVVSRSVDARGRSQARIDGRPVALRDLRRLGEFLIEIHGQGASQSLVRPESQTELLDAYAGLGERRRELARELHAVRALAERLAAQQKGEHERRERAEFLRFCLADIDRVGPRPGEMAELLAEAGVLRHLDQLRQVVEGGVRQLSEGEDGGSAPILEQLARLQREVVAAVAIDARLEGAARLVEEGRLALEEAARELRDGRERLDLDPLRLEAVEQRLADLQRLLERFGPSEEQLVEARQRMRKELALCEDATQSPEALQAELMRRVAELEASGGELTQARTKAARALSRTLVRELADLGMERLRAEVRIVLNEGDTALSRLTDLGTSHVEVFLAPNPGEPLTALQKTASGGEVARVMLALKKILADQDCVPVLVFDEIDAEIGGRLGLAMGRKLRQLATDHQVLCVTHLPQIAAFAHGHWLVAKRVETGADGERTVSELRELAGDDRQRELASMTRGEGAIDRGALAEAGRLLELAADVEAASSRLRAAGDGGRATA
jgi:DNA repair protein RecN (Recombination protein N)